MKADRGIMVIAQGASRYICMAKNIAMSLQLSNPGIPRVLVTDSQDPDLLAYYNAVLPADPEFGVGFSQKIHADKYSPFQRTILIDVDCLVIRDISWLFERFEGKPVSVIGRKVMSGPSIGSTVEKLREQAGVQYLLSFNGGVYYFEKRPDAQDVFNEARRIFSNEYDALGLVKFNGRPGDEPVMSVAMGKFGMEPIDDDWHGMYTPVGQSGVFRMDALKGYCEFYKYGQLVKPAIMHFGGGYPEAFHYRRERMKILIKYRCGLPGWLISGMVNLIYNPPYIVFVFFYRLLKTAMGKSRFKLSPIMPMFRFE
jgi:hypothetical protein